MNSTVAHGVNVTTRGLSYVISASKEVIVSAGVFFSPQLLMLSSKYFAAAFKYLLTNRS